MNKGHPEKASVGIASDLAKILPKYLPNTCPHHYRVTNLFGQEGYSAEGNKKMRKKRG
jgi:hypothetical protein